MANLYVVLTVVNGCIATLFTLVWFYSTIRCAAIPLVKKSSNDKQYRNSAVRWVGLICMPVLYALDCALQLWAKLYPGAHGGKGCPIKLQLGVTGIAALEMLLLLLVVVVKRRVCTRVSLAIVSAACCVLCAALFTSTLLVKRGVCHAAVNAFDIARLVLETVQATLAALWCAHEIARRSKRRTVAFARHDAEEALLPGHDEARDDDIDDSWSKRLSLACNAMRYVWPEGGRLKVNFMLCVALVIVERCLNLLVPVAYKRVVDKLSHTSVLHFAERVLRSQSGIDALRLLLSPEAGRFWNIFYPWVLWYLIAYFLQGGAGGSSVGLLANIRGLLWIPITQFSYRRISKDCFGHLLDLDLQYHLNRKIGHVMRILDRGTSSIQNLMLVVLFNVGPQILDIVMACSYIALRLEAWVAIIVFVTIASFIPVTIVVTEWRGKVRQQMNKLDNEREAKATDMLLNYETVKYFTNEVFEVTRYDGVVKEYQKMEFLQMACLNVLNMLQSSVIFFGLACGLVVCVNGVAHNTLTVGDTVLFLTMMNQLYAPLNFFASYYRQTQKALIDMENMFDLLRTVPMVRDAANAPQLAITHGAVEFRNVTFSYGVGHDPVIRNMSFKAEGGSTLALVGSTGSGKSSVLRLLLRFYDPQHGAVLYDGTDIRSVTQKSLRASIAVVPQDCMLFNDTILFNIAYGRLGASLAEVQEAAQVAQIHDAIVERFPDGYKTMVGERGLRLSGGEKQRVALARALLKQPRIMLLDEATSALDTLTEHSIQAALAQMQQQVTKIIVAHRLSTVMDADHILVLERGEIVEAGTHASLLEQQGVYAALWMRQQDSLSNLLSGTRSLSVGNLPSLQNTLSGRHLKANGVMRQQTVELCNSPEPHDVDTHDETGE